MDRRKELPPPKPGSTLWNRNWKAVAAGAKTWGDVVEPPKPGSTLWNRNWKAVAADTMSWRDVMA